MKVIESKLQSEMEDLHLNDVTRSASAAASGHSPGGVGDGELTGNTANVGGNCPDMGGRGGRWRFGPGHCKKNRMEGCHMKRRRMRMIKAMMENENAHFWYQNGNPDFAVPSLSGPMMWRHHQLHSHHAPPMFAPWMWRGAGMHGGPYMRPHHHMMMGMPGPTAPMHAYGMMAMSGGPDVFPWKKAFCCKKGKGKKTKESARNKCQSSSEDENAMPIEESESSASHQPEATEALEENAKKHFRKLNKMRWKMYAKSMGMGQFGRMPPPFPPPPHMMPPHIGLNHYQCNDRKQSKDSTEKTVDQDADMNVAASATPNSTYLSSDRTTHQENDVVDDQAKESKGGHCNAGRGRHWQRAMAMYSAFPPPPPPPHFMPPWMMCPPAELDDSEDSDGAGDKDGCRDGQGWQRGDWRGAMAMSAQFPGAVPPPFVQRWMQKQQKKCQKGKKEAHENAKDSKDKENMQSVEETA